MSDRIIFISYYLFRPYLLNFSIFHQPFIAFNANMIGEITEKLIMFNKGE
jgi:hypothetical protein